ncbi:hypothetical protein OGAPHI_000955 [Ogataea philodendri]|uniref:tRNA (guanine(9)-N1)-methyltransferase n=1 Tax=Ogataea philodendri TaxID=1378263 RepID=A0A9P8PF13_9ASCO|nr:uncharacterized protein OGAPHI_000955 [Ogataea philodendri]KAH3670440.1 hypothetical protein OGAPHI_000955 [Ogataea philodendri]
MEKPEHRVKPVIPEGMSKSAWKKEQRRLRWDANRDKMRIQRKEKRKAVKESRKLKNADKPKKDKVVQQDSGYSVVVDCAFDDMMLDKEIVSTSNQLVTSYADNKKYPYRVDLTVTSFGKRLKERFDTVLPHYANWKPEHMKFTPESLESVLPEDYSKAVYLTADTDEILETLEPGMTYIVGGIVDKGRHKLLCKKKADELGIPTKRLPIDEYIKISGRRVLATSHVVEMLIRRNEFDSWKEVFESVIPLRKVKKAAEETEEGEETE